MEKGPAEISTFVLLPMYSRRWSLGVFFCGPYWPTNLHSNVWDRNFPIMSVCVRTAHHQAINSTLCMRKTWSFSLRFAQGNSFGYHPTIRIIFEGTSLITSKLLLVYTTEDLWKFKNTSVSTLTYALGTWTQSIR